jgi:hypothetical protein
LALPFRRTVFLPVDVFVVREALLERDELLLDVDLPDRDLALLVLLFAVRLTGAFAKDIASRLSERLF